MCAMDLRGVSTIWYPGNSYEDHRTRESIEKVAQSRHQVGGQEEGLTAIHITQFSLGNQEKICIYMQLSGWLKCTLKLYTSYEPLQDWKRLVELHRLTLGSERGGRRRGRGMGWRGRRRVRGEGGKMSYTSG